MSTRREFCRIWGSLLLGRRLLRSQGQAPLSWGNQPDARGGTERRYRADAQIVLLSIPVLHRKSVGDGASSWRESTADDGTMLRLLEFSGRSAPEHAAGLNRFGFIQELSRTVDRTFESIYFGVMTASPEETAADARKALHSNSKDAAFSVIEGRIVPAEIETAVHWVLRRPGIFLNTPGDIHLLPRVLEAASRFQPGPQAELDPQMAALAPTPLFM